MGRAIIKNLNSLQLRYSVNTILAIPRTCAMTEGVTNISSMQSKTSTSTILFVGVIAFVALQKIGGTIGGLYLWVFISPEQALHPQTMKAFGRTRVSASWLWMLFSFRLVGIPLLTLYRAILIWKNRRVEFHMI